MKIFILTVLFMMFLNYVSLFIEEEFQWTHIDKLKLALCFPFFLLFNVILLYPLKQLVLRLPQYKCYPTVAKGMGRDYYKCSRHDADHKIDRRYWTVHRGCVYSMKDLKDLKNWKEYYKKGKIK